MYNYFICFNSNTLGTVSGYEAAWNAYRKAKELAFVMGWYVALVDAQTGEVIDDNAED